MRQFREIFAFAFLLLLPSIIAQSSSSASSIPLPSSASSSSASISSTTASEAPAASTGAVTGKIFSGSGGYSYIGCYNETTGSAGVRTLADGKMISDVTLTPEACINYCSSNGTTYNYAGLEYGRECWCGLFINALSQHLPDSSCNMNCVADPSLVCGGNLVLTMYNRTSSTTKKGIAPSVMEVEWWSVMMGFGGAVLGAVIL